LSKIVINDYYENSRETAGLRNSNEVIDWLTKYDDSEIENRENIFGMSKKNGIYSVEHVGNLYGHECKIVIMLDPEKRKHSRLKRHLRYTKWNLHQKI
jgi:hypothetical protein